MDNHKGRKDTLRRNIKLVAAFLAVMLILLTGCMGGGKSEPGGGGSGGGGSGGRTSASGLDISQRVELQFYMLGDAPVDLPLIEAEINKMLVEDLNATVKFNFTTWTDWEQKYRLLLTSGQPVDLIFTAEWTQYQAYAKNGAFLALDDLLPKVAPKLYAFVPQEMWDAVRIDGKIQTVPATWKEYVTFGNVWREDLREKYNLPIPDSLENVEKYLAGIKQNEPDMIPLAANGLFHTPGYYDFKYEPAGVASYGFPYGLYIPYDDPSNVQQFWGSERHLEDLLVMKRWMDNGYISRNVLTTQDTAHTMLVTGKSALMMGDNPNRWNSTNQDMKSTHPDWELGYYPYPLKKGYATPVHPIHNGFAIPISSQNPERALAFYELMVTDKRYNWLTQYGIEGTHFQVTEDGYYEGLSDSFKREGMNGWAWRNPEYMLFDESFEAVNEIFHELDKIAKPDIFTGFAEDWTPYQAERAALEQVRQQYLHPLEVGLVDDVEAGLRTFMEKAKEAGLETIQKSYTEQWLNYLKEAGIQ